MADTKLKPITSMRTPKPKKTLGLSVPPALRLPHEDLITPQRSEKEEINAENSSMPSQTRHTTIESISSMPSQTRHTTDETLSAAPQRDYTKVANSIGRQAVPAGLFSGKSKQLYDCLYSMTRGAITPTRTVRISRPQLMKKSNIGSRATFEANIERLADARLIEVRQISGEHKGNEYTVLIPGEETSTMPSQTSTPSQTRHAQFLDRLVRLETSQTRHSSIVASKDAYAEPKTSFKTDDDDTHTARLFVAEILSAARCVVGVNLDDSEQERERWREFGNLIAEEILQIGRNAKSISSLPALMTEHFRRRLGKTPSALIKKEIESDSIASRAKEEGTLDTQREVKLPIKPSQKPSSGIPPTSEPKSKFKFEECRAYAEHLHKSGQGITNPGGYATTIHRTGEADSLIEKLIAIDKVSPPTPDAKQCPDCGGTGFWYPNGIEKGVAKCKHEKLLRSEE